MTPRDPRHLEACVEIMAAMAQQGQATPVEVGLRQVHNIVTAIHLMRVAVEGERGRVKL